MIDFGDLMELAMERINPYLPDDYEMDDCQWDDRGFLINVFYVKECGMPNVADRLRFSRYPGETDDETMERYESVVQKFAESWRGLR